MNINKIRKVDTEQFIDVKTPEVAYLLGLIWADGCVVCVPETHRYVIQITNTLTDALIFNDIAQKTGKWNFNTYGQRGSRKPIGVLSTSNKELVEFLIDNDYKSKSWESADKILSHIPEDIKHYWFRGLLDGDGCLSNGVDIASSYKQDWGFMIKLCNKLQIEYQLHQRINNKNGYKFSSFNIQKIKFADRFCNYIYQNYEKDKIGLERKYNQYCNFHEHHINKQKRNVESGISKYKNGNKFYINFRLNNKKYYDSSAYTLEDAINIKKEMIYHTQGPIIFEDYYGFKYISQ